MKWYYAEGQNHLGPFESDQFAALIGNGTISPKTYVWREGMAGWQLLSSINQGEIGSASQGSAAPVTSPAKAVAAALADKPKEQPKSAASVLAAALADEPKAKQKSAADMLAAALAEDGKAKPKSASAVLAAALADEPKAKPKSSADILAAALAGGGAAKAQRQQPAPQPAAQRAAAQPAAPQSASPAQTQQASIQPAPVKRNLQLRSKATAQTTAGGNASSRPGGDSGVSPETGAAEQAASRNSQAGKKGLPKWVIALIAAVIVAAIGLLVVIMK